MTDASHYKETADRLLHAFAAAKYDTSQLGEVIRYVLDGAGKRVRASLAFYACNAVSSQWQGACEAAIAVELIHAYSLVHDDLPCMDNDDYRRGRPTAHKKYSDALALLAGDALLTDAFDLLARGFTPLKEYGQTVLTATQRLKMVETLALAAGSNGMVRGQALDLFWTSRPGAGIAELNAVHLGKTGALMGASCALGAVAGGATEEQVMLMQTFGENIGLAFQIFDDLLDNEEGTGKSAGKDRESKKLTYLALLPAAEARNTAESLTDAAIASLRPFGAAGASLGEYVRLLLHRKK